MPARRRFYIRYAQLRWNDSRWFGAAFLVATLVLIALALSRHQDPAGFVGILVLYVLFLASLYAIYRTSYLEIGADELRIRTALRTIPLPYTSLTRIRKQPLEVAFQPADRRRYLNRFVRRLAREPAVYLRVDRRNPELLSELERRLGRRVVVGQDIVLPITDPDAFVGEVKGRLRGPA